MILLSMVYSTIIVIGEHKAAEELVKHDPYGLLLAFISISVVMTVLAFIYLSFKMLTRIILHKNKVKAEILPVSQNTKNPHDMPSGDISAAIAMALSLYYKQEIENENNAITIKKIAHRYSPWNSKIYMMRKLP
jgi:glutaconyl-CoA/methylmalonyl-CoA decarboxylase subunit delta